MRIDEMIRTVTRLIPPPAVSGRNRRGDDRGIALIIVLMAVSLISALGLALTLTTMAERTAAGTFGDGTEAFYAADAGIERAMQDLMPILDWTDVLSGVVRSTFTDGVPSGVRRGPGGQLFDLSQATNTVRCGKAVCSNADLSASTEDRPWGSNNPVWQPYTYGRVDQLLSGGVNSELYLVVWVADDQAENDGDPLRDGGWPAGCDPGRDPACIDGNPGRGILRMRARAFGPGGAQRTIDATVRRTDRVRLLSWRALR